MFIKLQQSVLFLFSFVLLLFNVQITEAQVNQEWVQTYNGPGNSSDEAKSIAIDNFGNIYITGYSVGIGTDYDYATVKYNSSGVEIWNRRYNGLGNGNDQANSIAVDDLGNVYVTGYSYDAGTHVDYATIKYNSLGDEMWVKRYNGAGNYGDHANSIAVDDLGNVYVTGNSFGNGTSADYATIKYNSSGEEIWVKRYNGPENLFDFANSITVDGLGNVYVTGYSTNVSTSTDYATIKYNSSGDEMWVKRYNGPANHYDYATSIAVDVLGNVYVTGRSQSISTAYDYATIKYNSSGDEIWVKRYNGPGNHYDHATSIAVDGFGNVYITGLSFSFDTYMDFATIKYSSSGKEEWIKRYNGPENSYDQAYSIVVDGFGNVYITGMSASSYNPTYSDYVTLKYNSLGIQEWVQIYNGPDNNTDYANSISLDNFGNVFVTGLSYVTGSSYDFATIKYSQVRTPREITMLLIATIDSMMNAGILGEGNANSLSTKLNEALTKINEGQYNTAINNLNAFINEVGALVNSNRLTQAQGDMLTERANAVIEQISGDNMQQFTENPREFKLCQNYPNPFNPVTRIDYSLPFDSKVSIKVFDIAGREVAVLVDDNKKAGYYSVDFNASNLPSGVYFYKLMTDEYIITKKMVLIK